MKVLIACECSGIVRNAFAALGHTAVSCDLKPTETPGIHHQGNVKSICKYPWDLLIAFPPCTYLTVAGIHKTINGTRDERLTEEALHFVLYLYNLPIKHVAIENPVGVLSTWFRKPDQIINPFQFGHRERKRTCLWLKNLPLLLPTHERVPEEPTFVDPSSGKKRYSLDMLPRNSDRASIRSKTFQGIADAMAFQWSDYILRQMAQTKQKT
jgi:hypothetical protein